MAQVIIVSNRLPISVTKDEAGQLKFSPSVGGLATGLTSYVNRRKNRWIGWPGIASEDLTVNDEDLIVAELAKHNCTPVFLSKRQIDDFYNGYSNQVLWPLFHNLRRSELDPEVHKRFWQTYREVNHKYAEAALSSSDMGGHLWVHDYQLMLVPEMVRADRPDLIIGFFLHIPWPPTKNLSKIAEAKKLVGGILGSDMAGFHTPGYVANFMDSCQTFGWKQTGNSEIITAERTVRVANLPMGIDYQKFAAATRSRQVKAAAKSYRKKYRRHKLIVSIDRLDPSKGLVERVRAYGGLLEQYPKLRGRVIFAVVAAPSRMEVPAYQRLSKRLRMQVDEINQRYGRSDWQPIDYMNVSKSFEEVTALFQIADIAFITPLKDGMNLAAKEFVAAKRRGDGVLILSETAGAAEELKEDALIVNPAKPETMVAALHQGLTMRRRELRRRLHHMQTQLANNTVQDWAKEFIDTLDRPIPGTGARTIRHKLQAQLINDFRLSHKRLLLLDYDGSLVSFKEDYRQSNPPKAVSILLEKLAAEPDNEVVLISGRSSSDLEEWFGNLPLNLVAEHGASFKKAGHDQWQSVEKTGAWQKEILPILEKYTALTPGSKLEQKPHSLVWHYRGASPYYAGKYGVVLKRTVRPLLNKHGLQMVQGNKALDIKNSNIGKGIAAQRWLKQDHDFVIAIGDDATDEDLFAVLPESTPVQKIYSVKVGRGRTAANYRVASAKEVNDLLKKLF